MHLGRWMKSGNPYNIEYPFGKIDTRSKKNDSTFSFWMRQYVSQQGGTLQDLGSRVGCNKIRLSQLHDRGKMPSVVLMEKIMDSLGVSSFDDIESFLLS